MTSKDLAEKVSRLFNASIICVLNQATLNANKAQKMAQNKAIGKLPHYYSPEWMFETGEKTIASVDTADKKVSSFELP